MILQGLLELIVCLASLTDSVFGRTVWRGPKVSITLLYNAQMNLKYIDMILIADISHCNNVLDLI